jgi:hypothetical protein
MFSWTNLEWVPSHETTELWVLVRNWFNRHYYLIPTRIYNWSFAKPLLPRCHHSRMSKQATDNKSTVPTVPTIPLLTWHKVPVGPHLLPWHILTTFSVGALTPCCGSAGGALGPLANLVQDPVVLRGAFPAFPSLPLGPPGLKPIMPWASASHSISLMPVP